MAIAFDAATSATQVSGSSLTFAHANSAGSNRIMFGGDTDGGAATLTSITYNGSAFTAISNVQIPLDRNIYLRYLIAPASGTNNVVVTLSGSTTDWVGGVSSYTGAKQTGQPDASNSGTGSAVTTLAVSVTTVADNCWLVALGGYSNGSTASAGANTTERIDPGNSFWVGDSNGAQTPAGSYSQTFNFNLGTAALLVASIAPAVAAASGPTNLKSYNTNVKSNIKSINTNLIANVKSFDTNA